MAAHENPNEPFDPSFCDKKGVDHCKGCDHCYTSTEPCIHARRCFMTGEYCSKQPNIQRMREKLYEKESIKAFVVMNFSDMSDVVYNWRLKTFIETLSSYLYIDKTHNRLYCCAKDIDDDWNQTNGKDGAGGGDGHDKRRGPDRADIVKVVNIEVTRSDTDPASNYVVCNRICQQMQIADLVVVDVSSQNANVFYELGMAVAFGKMILPICYSESFFKMVIPEKYKEKHWKLPKHKRVEMERHIGFYPWRKDLYEYYGIRYKSSDFQSVYLKFKTITKPKYGFSDIKYDRFPYHEQIFRDSAENEKNAGNIDESESKDEEDKKRIGYAIYNKLRKKYNAATEENNTLVVYTMDAFLNKEQAGRCIVNFYKSITRRMQQERCFHGERVGVLVQENVIPENEKDAKGNVDLFYNVGEIIQIGTNQATYLAAEEKIKSNDDFIWCTKFGEKQSAGEMAEASETQIRSIERFVKEHIKNRAMRIYPNNPVFVDRMKNLLHKDLLEDGKKEYGQNEQCCELDEFCLYHVMLRTLRYTNEIVVDISNNCLQSLFWLGAAHGSDINAVTVFHEKTDAEKNDAQRAEEEGNGKERTQEIYAGRKENRNVFDVAGLWMAILRKDDTEGFYRQLELAQSGIERRSKLMLPNGDFYKRQMREYLFSNSVLLGKEDAGTRLKKLCDMKEREEKDTLESYYRDRFWAPMLSYNQLSIYLAQTNELGVRDHQPKLCMSKWDYNVVSVFSHYLSKRKMIGEYRLISLPPANTEIRLNIDYMPKSFSGHVPDPEKVNFICVGSRVEPLKTSLPQDISRKLHRILPESNMESEYNGIEGVNIVHECLNSPMDISCGLGECTFKGFRCVGDEEKGIFTRHPKIGKCTACKPEEGQDCKEKSGSGIAYSRSEAKDKACRLKRENEHCEIAQLILWREDAGNPYEHNYFRVGIIGSSGPATAALSTLLVNKEEKYFEEEESGADEKANQDKNKDEVNLLFDLQDVIRKKFMEVFLKRLENTLEQLEIQFIDGETQKDNSTDWERKGAVKSRKDKENDKVQEKRYFALVEYAVVFYLNTVLYRYFFPFLSEKDMDRIHNGMYTFVNSMKAARVSPFALDYQSNKRRDYSSVVSNDSITKVIEEIPKILFNTLRDFKGLEAFYKVTVRHDLSQADQQEDTRELRGIEKLEDRDFSGVNCFFIDHGVVGNKKSGCTGEVN